MTAAREDLAPVVHVTNGHPTTTSLILAEKFGKRHDNVLRAVENPPYLSPRHRRIVHALDVRSRTREQIDRIAGASNGPDEVMRLRAKLGVEIPCVRIPAFDRDGHDVQVGVYSLTAADRRKINAWLSKHQTGTIDAALAGLIAFCAVCALLVLGVI